MNWNFAVGQFVYILSTNNNGCHCLRLIFVKILLFRRVCEIEKFYLWIRTPSAISQSKIKTLSIEVWCAMRCEFFFIHRNHFRKGKAYEPHQFLSNLTFFCSNSFERKYVAHRSKRFSNMAAANEMYRLLYLPTFTFVRAMKSMNRKVFGNHTIQSTISHRRSSNFIIFFVSEHRRRWWWQ